MGSIAIFGGGYFFSPFNVTATYGNVALTNGALPGVPGAWVEVTAASIRGRWLQVDIANPSVANSFAVQLGRGAPGLEVLWQPTAGLGGFWAEMPIGTVHPPRVYSFPISLEENTRIVARSSGAALATIVIIVNAFG
ncbi:MAG: hypothetical protein GY950_00735 [bacterium]|nr:hypothetical protein [bacterium]